MPFFNNVNNLQEIFAEQTRFELEKNKFIKNAQNIVKEEVEVDQQTPMKINKFQEMLLQEENLFMFSTEDKTPENLFNIDKQQEQVETSEFQLFSNLNELPEDDQKASP